MCLALCLGLGCNITPKSAAIWGRRQTTVREILLCATVLAATSAASGFAADTPLRSSPLAPMFAPTPIYSWPGSYVAENDGLGGSNGRDQTRSDAIFRSQPISVGGGSRFVGAGQLTGNFRIRAFAGGIEKGPTDSSPFGGLAPVAAPKLSSAAAVLTKPLARLGADRQTRDALLARDGPLSANAAGRNLAESGIIVQGVNDEMLSEAPASSDAATLGLAQSYPLSAQALADQRNRAARYGAGSAADKLASSDAELPPTPIATLPPGQRPRAFDASEGTPLDPLLNKTYDLTYAKKVPSLP